MEEINSNGGGGKTREQILRKGVFIVVVYLLLNGCVFFLSYGGWNWPQAWVLLSFWLVYYLLVASYGMRRNPEVVLERSQLFDRKFNAWDRWILPLYMLLTYSLYIICGLDAGRFGWSDVPTWVMWPSLVFPIVVYSLLFLTAMHNPFASCSVRIQTESGHYTVSSGPYRFVRHPMYTTAIPFGFGYPLFLGSYWGLIPGTLVVVLFVLRTALEDRYLQENLEGYREYAEQVRWRLVPGVW
jgi:protein-S-isoprenylcysteine O-methyltransferase Ste14